MLKELTLQVEITKDGPPFTMLHVMARMTLLSILPIMVISRSLWHYIIVVLVEFTLLVCVWGGGTPFCQQLLIFAPFCTCTCSGALCYWKN